MQSLLVLSLLGLCVAAAAAWALRAYARQGGAAADARRALAVCALAGAGALGLYLALGDPGAPDTAYARRVEALRGRDPAALTRPEVLALLAAQARQSPKDPRPHLFMGQILAEAGRDGEAVRAFDAALRRDPRSGPALLGQGRALVQLQDGAVGPEALARFEAAAALLPNDPTPVLYQALAASQTGRAAEAGKLWREVLERLPPDDPRRAMAEAMIAGTAQSDAKP